MKYESTDKETGGRCSDFRQTVSDLIVLQLDSEITH